MGANRYLGYLCNNILLGKIPTYVRINSEKLICAHNITDKNKCIKILLRINGLAYCF